MLPFHIQKLREKGQYRVAQVGLHNGSQPTGLVGAESQPTLCQAVHPGMGCICLKRRGTLLQLTKRLEALIWSWTLRALSPNRRGIYSSLPNKEPYGDPPKRNPLLEYKKVQVNTLCRDGREKRVQHRTLLWKGKQDMGQGQSRRSKARWKQGQNFLLCYW